MRIRAAVVLLLLLMMADPPDSIGAISFVKSGRTPNQAASTTCVISLTGVVAGDTLIVGTMWNSSTATATISDGVNTYSVDIGPITHGSAARRAQVWHADNVASGTTTITVTFSASVTNSCIAHEVSGLATSASFDKSSSGTGVSSSQDSGLTATTAQANEYLFGMSAGGTDSAPWTAGTNYTAREASVNPDPGHFSEDRIVAATGTYNATSTSNVGTNWIAIITTYKEAGAAPSGPPHQLPTMGCCRMAVVVDEARTDLRYKSQRTLPERFTSGTTEF